MPKKIFLLVCLLPLLILPKNASAQYEEAVSIASEEACNCIKNFQSDSTLTSFEEEFEKCLVNFFEENSDLLVLFGSDSTQAFDISMIDEEFGEQIGYELLRTCPAFLEVMLQQEQEQKEQTEKDSYQRLLDANEIANTKGCEEGNIVYSEIINTPNVPDSTLTTTYNNRGYCKYLLGDYYGAIGDLSTSIERYPGFVLALSNRGLAKRSIGDYNGAILDFSEALKYDPVNITSLNGRGLTYYYQSKFSEALNDYQTALNIDSTQAYLHFNSGLAYQYLEDDVNAVRSFEKNYELGGNFTDQSYYLAQSYTNIYEYDKAINILLDDSLTMSDPINLLEVGKNFYYKERYRDAIKYFDLSLNIDSTSFETNMFKAYALQDSTLHQASLEYFERTFLIDSTSSNLTYYYGYSLFELEDFEGAETLFSKTISLDESFTQAYDYRARARVNLNKIEEAINDFTMSIELYPNDAQIYLERGKLYLEQDEKEKACIDFNLAFQLELESEELDSIRANSCSE
ncbi:MAG: tetratricopeptide repeat protein [Balneola sp.]|nr:MAG: tetratricopeptide repeat protein [Balneola sp.]